MHTCIGTVSREQIARLPERLEEYMSRENPVQVLDAFAEGIPAGGTEKSWHLASCFTLAYRQYAVGLGGDPKHFT